MKAYCLQCGSIQELTAVSRVLFAHTVPFYRGKCEKCDGYAFKRMDVEVGDEQKIKSSVRKEERQENKNQAKDRRKNLRKLMRRKR